MKIKIATATLQKQFQQQVDRLWPALKGSLAQVRKPCIRPNCQACARGDKHPAYLLSFTDKGRRRCMYVPAQMIALLKKGLKNGRHLEQLLYQMGPTLLRHYRQHREAKDKGSKTPSGCPPPKKGPKY